MDTNTQFTLPLRIYYEDTDASGVVYHAQYFKYFERARTEWLRALGYDQERLRTELNLAFTVVSAQVEYRQPARLDDEIRVTVTLIKQRKASLKFEQMVHCGPKPLTQASFRIASVSADTFRPRAIPDAIIETIMQEMQ